MFDNRKLRLALAIACLAIGAANAHAGDVSKGEKVFKKCMACHTVADKANKVGPYLTGLVNRPVASAEGYAYSDAMKEFASQQPAWDEAVLDKYLENPKAMVPKTKMAFAGLKKADERADLIAFLLTKQ
ncbi:MAG: cytochrome c family protein [Rhizobiales bacterium]|nr:cytochrome c family protein [Hyphomicrobiales bacterium]